MKEINAQMYIIVGRGGRGLPHTLDKRKKDCINNFIEGTSYSWTEIKKKFGWRCEKVDVQIMSSSNYEGWN